MYMCVHDSPHSYIFICEKVFLLLVRFCFTQALLTRENVHKASTVQLALALAHHDLLQKSRRDLVFNSLFLQRLRHNGQLALKRQARMDLRRAPLMDPLVPLSGIHWYQRLRKDTARAAASSPPPHPRSR